MTVRSLQSVFRARLGLAMVAAALAVLFALPSLRADNPVAPAAWPARISVPDHAEARGIIRVLDAPMGLIGMRTGPSLVTKPTEADLADARALLPDANTPGGPKVEFERPGSYIFRATRAIDPAAQPAGPLRFVFVSARPGSGPDAPARIERTWFTFHEPKPAADAKPRGLALLMPGMFGTPEPVLELFVTRLRSQGWGVVQMMAQPSRFTERAVFPVDPAGLPASAAAIAAEFDQRAAECAYAVQAAMAHVARERPALAGLPRIAVGMSGGAMTMPSVLAREPDRYAAVVMIAGGCHYLAINEESNYKFVVNAIDLSWPAMPSDEDRKRLADLYLERSRLDSYHAAAAIVGKPMLLIHGSFDGAVPARLGDLLWERLGKPERWVHEAGHEEIFIKLPGQMDRIMEWLAARTAAAPAGSAPSEPEKQP